MFGWGYIFNKGLSEQNERAIICPQFILSGRSAVRLARLHGVQEVPGSTPGAPTGFYPPTPQSLPGELVFFFLIACLVYTLTLKV